MGIIGTGSPMQGIKKYIRKVAETDSTVLINGETGTGKELAAEFIHQLSKRRNKPFVCINCAALPENLLESELFGYERGAFTGAMATRRGKFEIATQGTIFLDEISDLSPHAQAKILRIVETKEAYRLGGHVSISMDSRIIAATNQDPEQLIQENKFRKDLYYRLNVAQVYLPPLRDRRGDIQLLIDYFIRDYNKKFRRNIQAFSKKALDYLLNYDWPGNIRELKNLVEATYINLPLQNIDFIELPDLFIERLRKYSTTPECEREQLLSALTATNWNKSKAAEKLNWSRMTLYRKLRKYELLNKTG
jgi:transcriptional regulator with PAS, ATPase and Fis domain